MSFTKAESLSAASLTKGNFNPILPGTMKRTFFLKGAPKIKDSEKAVALFHEKGVKVFQEFADKNRSRYKTLAVQNGGINGNKGLTLTTGIRASGYLPKSLIKDAMRTTRQLAKELRGWGIIEVEHRLKRSGDILEEFEISFIPAQIKNWDAYMLLAGGAEKRSSAGYKMDSLMRMFIK
jgi:hypothetical protein